MIKVLDCNERDCAYNRNKECHAVAITVGGPEPRCDTFIRGTERGGFGYITAGIGACKVKKCRFNELLECTAMGVHVGVHSGHADCKTFKPK